MLQRQARQFRMPFHNAVSPVNNVILGKRSCMPLAGKTILKHSDKDTVIIFGSVLFGIPSLLIWDLLTLCLQISQNSLFSGVSISGPYYLIRALQLRLCYFSISQYTIEWQLEMVKDMFFCNETFHEIFHIFFVFFLLYFKNQLLRQLCYSIFVTLVVSAYIMVRSPVSIRFT